MSDFDENEGDVTDETIVNDVDDENTEGNEGDEGADESDAEPQDKGKERQWVEFTPEQQAKFNDVYKQVKMSDARNQMLTKMLEEQQRQLDEIKARTDKTDNAEAENVLRTRLKEARDNGDEDKADEILIQLAEFRLSAKKQQEKKPEVKRPELEDVDPDTRYVVALAEELDDKGQLARPWLREDHPQYKTALTQATVIAAGLEAQGKESDIPTIMAELDKKMNQKKTPNNRAVDPMSRGNLTSGQNGSKIKPKLSAVEKDIAKKLGMSEADYLDGKQTYGSKR